MIGIGNATLVGALALASYHGERASYRRRFFRDAFARLARRPHTERHNTSALSQLQSRALAIGAWTRSAPPARGLPRRGSVWRFRRPKNLCMSGALRSAPSLSRASENSTRAGLKQSNTFFPFSSADRLGQCANPDQNVPPNRGRTQPCRLLLPAPKSLHRQNPRRR